MKVCGALLRACSAISSGGRQHSPPVKHVVIEDDTGHTSWPHHVTTEDLPCMPARADASLPCYSCGCVHRAARICLGHTYELLARGVLLSGMSLAIAHTNALLCMPQIQRGCERNVITYSSLISACEKAGRWELALDLFGEMHREGCKPNVVTYNSLIAACAQGVSLSPACLPVCTYTVCMLTIRHLQRCHPCL